MRMPSPMTLPLRLLFVVVALALPLPAAFGAVTLTHVHGLAYSADGKRLYIPSHHGLAVYGDGKWTKAPGPQHDYMGFAATRDRFYSSGHPAPGSGLINPFGLIRSDDAGNTWKKLGLEGESDFHLLATSYATNAIYVFNHAPNSRMHAAGIHYTLNDGLAWRRARGAGLKGEPTSLAVHPEDSKRIAVGTENGLYLSADSGDSFRAVASGQVLAVFCDLDSKHLWYASYGGAPALHRMDWQSSEQTAVPLPALAEDAVAYIAQNPARRSEYAIATFKRNVFLTSDGGRAWQQIARDGQGLDR